MKTKKTSTVLKKLGKFINVRNCKSSNYNDVPNQYIIDFENGTIFKSYDSIIAIITGGKTYIGHNWDYSNTTGKYRNIFLGEEKKETQKKIESGEYIMLN